MITEAKELIADIVADAREIERTTLENIRQADNLINMVGYRLLITSYLQSLVQFV